jgi:hypothetical protein
MTTKYYHLQFTIAASTSPDARGISIAATKGYIKFSTNAALSASMAGLTNGFYTNNTLTNGVTNDNVLIPNLSPRQDPVSNEVELTLNNINEDSVTKDYYTLLTSLTPDGIVINNTSIDDLSKDFVNATGGTASSIVSYKVIGTGGGSLVNSSGYLYYVIGTEQYETTSVFTFTTIAGPGASASDFGSAVHNCFLEGTKLYAHVHDKDLYVNIEDLREGDLVNTYLHGKKAIKFIGKDSLFNKPDKWNGCLKKFPKSEDMIDDLYITGAHSLLVDELSENEAEGVMAIYGTANRKIDDKFMLNAWASEKAEPVLDSDFFTIYHLVLEHDDDEDKKYGIWANGVLTESQSERHFVAKSYKLL